MATPIQFTIRYQDQANAVFAENLDLKGVTGELWFTPIFDKGSRIPYVDGVGLCPREFRAYLDSDGSLRDGVGGDLGVRLWANDPAFDLERFAYQVTAPKGLRVQGLPATWRAFEFDSPASDVVVYLKNEMPGPGQNFKRGRSAFPLTGGHFNDDGNLVLKNGDGSELEPITVPPGTIVVIDNGDGTYDVGPLTA